MHSEEGEAAPGRGGWVLPAGRQAAPQMGEKEEAAGLLSRVRAKEGWGKIGTRSWKSHKPGPSHRAAPRHLSILHFEIVC